MIATGLRYSPEESPRLLRAPYDVPPTGYNGGMFETTKGIKGGGFDEEQTAYRFVMGKGTVIPGLEEGIAGMKPGGVRQIIVPPEVGRAGDKPNTFLLLGYTVGNRVRNFDDSRKRLGSALVAADQTLEVLLQGEQTFDRL